MKGCIVLLLAVGVTAFGQTNEIETYRTGLFNSTNYWGGGVEAFREQVRANLVPLRNMRVPEADVILCDWYKVELDLPVPTNTVRAYKVWLEQKARCLSGGGRAFLTSECSNLMVRAASFRREIISNFKCQEFLLAAREKQGKEIQERFANTVSSYCWVGDQDQLQMARENAAEEMRFGLVEFIGKRNIPLLPANERWSFYSNFVERACLNENDRAEIRRAIEKKEEKENR